MVLSSRDSTVESNGEQSKEDNDFLDQLRSFEKDNRRVITAIEIQKLEMEHKECVMNYFVYDQQTNSIVAYEPSFLELQRWAETWIEDKFDEKWVVSIFVNKLKEGIEDYVKLYCPDSLQRVIVLAKWRELSFVDKMFDKRGEREITQDESATNGIISTSLALVLGYPSMLPSISSSTPLNWTTKHLRHFLQIKKDLLLQLRCLTKVLNEMDTLLCLNTKPPDVYDSLTDLIKYGFNVPAQLKAEKGFEEDEEEEVE